MKLSWKLEQQTSSHLGRLEQNINVETKKRQLALFIKIGDSADRWSKTNHFSLEMFHICLFAVFIGSECDFSLQRLSWRVQSQIQPADQFLGAFWKYFGLLQVSISVFQMSKGVWPFHNWRKVRTRSIEKIGIWLSSCSYGAYTILLYAYSPTEFGIYYK